MVKLFKIYDCVVKGSSKCVIFVLHHGPPVLRKFGSFRVPRIHSFLFSIHHMQELLGKAVYFSFVCSI